MEVRIIGNLKFFENIVENKLLNTHTSFIGRVLSTNGVTAKIAPLGMSKGYDGSVLAQSPISNVPIIHSARWKLKKEKLRYVKNVSDHTPAFEEVDILVPTEIAAGDVVVCVCCERDISEAKKGNNSVPAVGSTHSMSNSVVVGIL